MLDPKEQAKGGFRAHAAREQERRDDLAKAGGEAGAPGAAEAGADGTPLGEPQRADGDASPYAPPTARQVKRWR